MITSNRVVYPVTTGTTATFTYRMPPDMVEIIVTCTSRGTNNADPSSVTVDGVTIDAIDVSNVRGATVFLGGTYAPLIRDSRDVSVVVTYATSKTFVVSVACLSEELSQVLKVL